MSTYTPRWRLSRWYPDADMHVEVEHEDGDINVDGLI